ncbi:MAG TPA: rhomboid family intramembrane serine protease [Bacteroidia bacterium]|nr:rhomboid family intramembrane serine protease [Bacteroidia bacterium]
MDQEHYSAPQEEAPPKRPFYDGLIPRGDYFFTPIIININILVFLAMVISGVSFTFPTASDLLRWGTNYKPLTMGGQPWRMFTSMFLHFGIIHLAVNMYSLFSLGRIIEPFVGRWRFLVLYLCAGLGGSAVSLWWHTNAAGAGASGAIFGLAGIFGALLTTDLIRKEYRGKMLRSIAQAIVINLAIGLMGSIDNSAHIGGLLTGAIGGYLIYFDLRSLYRNGQKKYTGLLGSVAVTVVIIAGLWHFTSVPPDFDAMVKRFSAEDQKASLYYLQMDNAMESDIRKNYILPYQHCVAITDSMEDQDLNDFGTKYVALLRLYAETRLNTGEALLRERQAGTTGVPHTAAVLKLRGDSLLQVINDLEKKNAEDGDK